MDDHDAVIAMLNHTWFGSELAPETQARLVKLGEVQDFDVVENEDRYVAWNSRRAHGWLRPPT